VNDLRVVMRQQESVELEWTAPGAFWGFGTVDRYQIFYSTDPISNQYSFLGVVGGPSNPGSAGSLERATVGGLSPGVKYYFSVRAQNWDNNWSTVSKNTDTFTKPRTDYLASEIPADPYLTAPGGDVYLWKTYNFDTTLDGTVRVELTGQADNNDSSDDDDLKIILDGVDYEWSSEYSLDGDANNKVKIIVIETDLTAGSHTLELWADETPSLHSLYVEGVNCQDKNFATYPQKRAPGGNLYLYKTYNFEVESTEDYYIEVAAAAESHGSADDDDLRIVIDDNDYGWGGTNGFDGDTEKGREKTVSITRNLSAGDHTLQIYADGNPILNAVEIYPTSDLEKVADLPASQLGLSTDLNVARWRVQQFSCDEGPAKIKVEGYAQKNGSSDDDDLKIVLDGIDYQWGSNKSFDGNLDNAQTRTLVLNQYLTAGVHTLEVYTDETPNLLSAEIFGTPSTQNYLVEAYPEETTSSLDVEVWKDTDYNFTLSNAGTVRFEVTGSADKNSLDDDDLKVVLVKTDSPTGNIDYDWNTTDALDGNSLKGAARKIIVEQFLRPGDYKLQIWGDVTPTLNSVLIQGVDSGGDLLDLSLNEPTTDLDTALYKDYYFSATGSTDMAINGFASKNHSDDDDLRIVLDGQDYDWNTDDALDGIRDNGENYTITINQSLSAGLHHLQIYADETSTIGSIVATGTGTTLNYRETDTFPNATAPGGDRYHWSAEDQDFTFSNSGVLIVTASAESHGSADDDDLKIKVDGQDYDWLFNGDSLKGDVKTVYIPLDAGSHSLEFYADITPTLYSVVAAETYSD
ncbi:fibronectin type III domain-containing protein, partial [Patescibacteria group bacterium]